MAIINGIGIELKKESARECGKYVCGIEEKTGHKRIQSCFINNVRQ